MFWLGLLLVVAVGLLLAAVLPRSRPKTQEGYGALLKSLAILWREEPELHALTLESGIPQRLSTPLILLVVREGLEPSTSAL